MNFIRIFFLLFLAVSFIPAEAASADIIKYFDEAGRLHFTDRPVKEPYVVFIKTTVPKYRPVSYSRRLYKREIARAAKKYGVTKKLIHSVIETESGYNRLAVSRAGARGLMQLMPKTAERYGARNVFSPAENIDGGVHYLKDLLHRYGGNVHLALAAYNAGESAVKKYGGVPPFPETRKFIGKVLRLYRNSRSYAGVSQITFSE